MTTLKNLAGVVLPALVFFTSSPGAADDFSPGNPVVKAVR
jgi:hypothetical protein